MVLEHFMVKKELTEAEIAESIPDLWQPLTQQQRVIAGTEILRFRNTKERNDLL